MVTGFILASAAKDGTVEALSNTSAARVVFISKFSIEVTSLFLDSKRLEDFG